MGYDHSIAGAIFIAPPIPAALIPADHPLNPHHHPFCRDRRTSTPIPATVNGHGKCTGLYGDLMFEIADGFATAIVPATHLSRKIGDPAGDLEKALTVFGPERFEGTLEFTGDEGEIWEIEVSEGRVQINGDGEDADEDLAFYGG